MPIEEFIISVYCEVCIPMPVCNFGLAPSSEAFRGEAAHGRRALKKETYYGFKGLVMIAADGIIVWHRFCRRQNNYSNREI